MFKIVRVVLFVMNFIYASNTLSCPRWLYQFKPRLSLYEILRYDCSILIEQYFFSLLLIMLYKVVHISVSVDKIHRWIKCDHANESVVDFFDDVTQNCDFLGISLKQKFISMLPGIHFFVNIANLGSRISESLQRIFLKPHKLAKFGTINRFMEMNFCFNEKYN